MSIGTPLHTTGSPLSYDLAAMVDSHHVSVPLYIQWLPKTVYSSAHAACLLCRHQCSVQALLIS